MSSSGGSFEYESTISSVLSEDSIIKMIDDFERKKILPQQSKRSQILQYLTSKRVEAADEQRYLDAAKYHNIYKNIRQAYLDEKSKETKRKQTTRDPEGNLEEIKRKISRTFHNYNKKRMQYNNQRDETIRRTKEEHWKEMKAFKDFWNDPNSLISFAKPSYKLQQLRVRERKQAIICDYEGAEVTKQLAAKLEKKETQIAQEKARKEMMLQYNAILEKQKKEINGIKHHYNRKLVTLEKEYNKKMEQLNLGLKWQEIEREELIRKTETVSTLSNAKVLYPPIEDEPSMEDGAMTPKAIQESIELRNRPKSGLLPLQGLQI